VIPTTRFWATFCLLALPTIAAGFVPAIGVVVLGVDLLLATLLAVDWFVARKTTIKVWRTLPARFQVGVVSPVDLHVISDGARPIQLHLKDDSPLTFSVSERSTLVNIPPRSRAKATFALTPSRRGKFQFGDIHLRVAGPLNLALHERHIAAHTAVSVFPDLRGASRLLLADAALDFVNLGLRQLRRDGRGSEFGRLRDYTQGDSVRDVDWKATARRGKPVTKVMESERSQTLLIGVDAGRAMAAYVDGLSKLDHAINAALFLAFVAIRNGDRVGLVIFSDSVKYFLPPNQGRMQYRRLVDALYATQAGLTTVDYLALFKELNVRLMRRSLLCVFTDFLDEDQAASMILPFQRLAKRHVPICLSVKDLNLHALLRREATEASLAFQQAVASDLLLERETARRRIARDGVRVIETDSQKLSLLAVNTYLDIKSRGLL
jgi:uncharacterized protein (DUF58 family)